MGFTVDLVTGLAEYLAAGGVGEWNADLAANPSGDQVAIVVGPNLPQTPDRVVCLTPYPLVDEPGMSEVTVGVQVRCRGTVDPRVAEDLADAVYDRLHGATQLTLGAVPVAQVWRASSAVLGPDSNHRHERSDNYYLQANRDAPHATD